jgi:PadR family transcriptional regulator, regulatory protein PadR
MRRPGGSFKRKPRFRRRFSPYILNIVKHIQDYYAPLIGEFEQVVLLSLLRLGNGTWGAAIRRDIQERIGRELPVSVVYVTLQRMEKKGMVKSYIGEPTAERGGRRRRHYLIDTPGEQALGRSYRALKSMCEGLETRLQNL